MGRQDDHTLQDAAVTNITRFEREPHAGTFTVKNSALYLRATTPPENTPVSIFRRERPEHFIATSRALYSWIRLGMEWAEPVPVSGRERVISFEDLIRLRVIALFRSRGVPYSEIRDAEDFVRRRFHIPQPFVTEQFWLAGDMLMAFAEHLFSISRHTRLQMAFPEMRPYFTPIEHGLVFDGKDGLVDLWRPHENVIIDPHVQFGAPCIEGTRVETEVLWAFNQAGDSPQTLARMYGLDIEQVNAALEWERRVDMAA